DFIIKKPDTDVAPLRSKVKLHEPWTLFTDRSLCVDGSGAGPILTNPEGMEFTYALRFKFTATNNEAEYEALIARLRITTRMGARNLEANVDSRLVANHVLGEYVAKEDNMVQYLDKTKSLIQGFDRFTIKQKDARRIRRKAQRFELQDGILYRRSFLQSWLRCVGPLQADYVLR
nr:reverse transcriptase domain-containing protein [Tanacetum cinerariifolium]